MQPNQPTGQFMNPGGNGQPGQGSALARLMAQRQQDQGGGMPNSGNMTPPASAPTNGSPIPPTLAGMGATPQSIGAGVGQAAANGVQPNQMPPEVQAFNNQQMMPPDSLERQIALKALQQFLGSHGKAVEARAGIVK